MPVPAQIMMIGVWPDPRADGTRSFDGRTATETRVARLQLAR